MGHIELAAPVTHIWYFKGVPSPPGLPAGPGAQGPRADHLLRGLRRHAHRRRPPSQGPARDRDGARGGEAARSRRRRDDDVKKRLNELEDRLKELEGEGAKGAQLSAAKREAQRDVERHHRGKRSARPSTSTRSLVGVQGPERQAAGGRRRRLPLAPRAVRRLLRRRHGRRGDQAPALGLRRRGRGRCLRDQIENGKGTRRLKAIKRLKVVSNFVDGTSQPRWAWCSTPSR